MDRVVEFSAEIFDRYLELLLEIWPWAAGLFAGSILAGALWQVLRARVPERRRSWAERWPARALALVAVAVAVWLALERASIVDDTYISCRYAQNLVEGHGLVWNIGERVEGYTNFLWTILIAAIIAVTPLEAPLVALGLSLACMAANIVVVYRIGRVLADVHEPRLYLPIAVALVAVQNVVTEFGTTGLETSGASLLVDLGLLFLLVDTGLRQHALAGAMFILAAFTRPDHGLFFAVGGLTVAARTAIPIVRARREGLRGIWRAGLDKIAVYSAPFLAYAAYLAWKLVYYGHLLPNTYYAKRPSAGAYTQGLVYTLTFLLGSHFWLLLVPFVIWFFTRAGSSRTRSFKVFVGLSSVVYAAYVISLGGDFMYGRFYLSLIPLVLLGVEDLVYSLRAAGAARPSAVRSWAAFIVAGLLLCTAQGVRMIGPDRLRWNIANEEEFYPLEQYFPVAIDHSSYRVGRYFAGLAKLGVAPVIATGGIGMVGYYSRLELVDLYGLTDSYVSMLEPTMSRPGHQRVADSDYLRKRRVLFARHTLHPERFRKLARVRIPNSTPWTLVTYPRDLMRKVREVAPELRILDFERYLDRYIQREAEGKSPEDLRRDLSWFDLYYFNYSDDPERRQAIARLASRPSGQPPTTQASAPPR
jgi:hypothetical protein